MSTLNILMPMAGLGERFSAEYDEPKPLIKIRKSEIPMGVTAALQIKPRRHHRFIFLFLQEHIENWGIDKVFRSYFPKSVIIPVAEVTEGAACTVLKAADFIDNENPLMIANSDQYIGCDIEKYLEILDNSYSQVLVMTTSSYKPSHSYIKYENGKPVGMVEKEVVSDEAAIGIYNCKYGNSWVQSAKDMIANNLRYKGEFYVAPAFNEIIRTGGMVTARYENIYFLGTPEEVKAYEELRQNER